MDTYDGGAGVRAGAGCCLKATGRRCWPIADGRMWHGQEGGADIHCRPPVGGCRPLPDACEPIGGTQKRTLSTKHAGG